MGYINHNRSVREKQCEFQIRGNKQFAVKNEWYDKDCFLQSSGELFMAFKQKCAHIPWYYAFVFLFLLGEAVFFFALGDNIYVSMHDNLDLHIADYHILSETDSFFSHGDKLPLLNGINRDYFASGLNLYSLLYFFLPSCTAYITGYLLKTVTALVSTILLAKEISGASFKKYEPVIVLIGFAYGILPLYPAFSLYFASLPLVVLLLLKIYRKPKVLTYLLLFLYPFLSYFTFFGFFILAYLLLAIVILWIRNKKPPFSLMGALVILSAGYMAFEYRLFGLMLFDKTATIRDTMVQGSYTPTQILAAIGETFTKGIFHAEAAHTFFVLPVCILYFVYLNLGYLKTHNYRGMFRDVFNLILCFLLFNCVVYGLYYQENLRSLVETLLPPLKGFQFTRTVFFNPFLWYLAFFVILKRFYDKNKKKAANIMALVSIGIILLTGSKYNDLYNTCFNYCYRIIKQQPSNSLTYREFYSEDLFQAICKDIGYSGEKSVAYGMHPAVLEYNGIFTLDGCLSYYPQEYKEQFRRIIAPALERVESFRVYYDDWGARAYLFAGVDENVYEPVRKLTISDPSLYIDADAFREMGGTYIFSRLLIDNEKELGLTLHGTYTDPSSPYTIYLYEAE